MVIFIMSSGALAAPLHYTFEGAISAGTGADPYRAYQPGSRILHSPAYRKRAGRAWLCEKKTQEVRAPNLKTAEAHRYNSCGLQLISAGIFCIGVWLQSAWRAGMENRGTVPYPLSMS